MIKIGKETTIQCGHILKVNHVKTWLKENPGCFYEFNRLDHRLGKNILHVQFFDSNKQEKKNLRLVVIRSYSPGLSQKNIESIKENGEFWEIKTVDKKTLNSESLLCY